jgi:YesN/AraC family two-component response regulator
LSIGEVAELTGYPDIRYFSRFFRRMNGMTPSEFRSRMLKPEE